MGYKLNKELCTALKIIASQLPTVGNETHEVHRLLGSEILELGTVTEIDGFPIIPAKMYRLNMPVILASNHYRRLKNAWKRNEKEGVQNYLMVIEKIRDQNKDNV